MKKSQIFTHVPVKRPNRNLFDLSHEVKMSGKFTNLMPVLLQECLPGDVFRNTSTILMRLAPMLAPVMHRINVTTHFFFVPNRLSVGQNLWESFITGGQDGDEAPVLPYLTPASVYSIAGQVSPYFGKGSLWDYMGLPTFEDADYPSGLTSTEQISMIPFLAYAKVWNDYYRDPNFDTEMPNVGADLEGNLSAQYAGGMFALQRRGWAKDYFTAALPFAQRGESVMLPLAGTGSTANWYAPAVADDSAGSPMTPGAMNIGTVGLQTFMRDSANASVRLASIPVTIDNSEVSINDFRTALAIQSWLENNARGGARYIEQIQAHFGERVPDYRLQRAEYLGGGMQPIQISEVLSTAATTNDTELTPVGDMYGHGISVGKSNQFTYRCQEHGYIIGVMSVMPAPAYQQGIDRSWSRRNKFDFGWPELAHLGEQELLNKEVYFDPLAEADGTGADDNDGTFGYIPRYSEYKFKQDRVAGDFRTNLSFWHLGRIFTQRPSLQRWFTTADDTGVASDEEPMTRIFAVQGDEENPIADYLWIDIFHRFTAKRPLPYFGVPQLRG